MVSGGQVDTLAYETDGPAGSRIELRQIEKTYGLRSGERVCALRDVNFNVTPSTFVSVVGASGCGKSTLLRIVGGLSRQTTGDVLLDGTPVTGPRRDIGFVFQTPELLPWRSVGGAGGGGGGGVVGVWRGGRRSWASGGGWRFVWVVGLLFGFKGFFSC